MFEWAEIWRKEKRSLSLSLAHDSCYRLTLTTTPTLLSKKNDTNEQSKKKNRTSLNEVNTLKPNAEFPFAKRHIYMH